MKSLKKFVLFSFMALFLTGGSAYGLTLTYNDIYANWPGWPINSNDEMGYPHVGGMTVTIDNNGYLDFVIIQMKTNERQVWDTLFINTGASGSYPAWKYYVRDDTLNNSTGAVLYSVNDPNNYTYLLALAGRAGHPAGINPNDLTPLTGILQSVVWDVNNNTLTYSFGDGIFMGSNFVIGYSQWCANDVFLTSEPGTLLLLGAGLLGLGFLARRKIKSI